jgi:hypothetical protein
LRRSLGFAKSTGWQRVIGDELDRSCLVEGSGDYRWDWMIEPSRLDSLRYKAE